MSALPIFGVWLAGLALNLWLARFDTRATRTAVAVISSRVSADIPASGSKGEPTSLARLIDPSRQAP